MLNSIIDTYKNFEKITYKILKNGLKICMLISFFAVLILFTYIFLLPSPIYFYIGIKTFKISLYLAIEFIICSFVVDGIKKQLI